MTDGGYSGWRRFGFFLPAVIAVVTSLGANYALLRTLDVRLTRTEADLLRHAELPGHPGVTERIGELARDLAGHESHDTLLYTTGFGGRIALLEQRVLDLERGASKRTASGRVEDLAKKKP